MDEPRTASDGSSIAERLRPYQRACVRRATIQLLNTAVPFAGLWLLMLWSLDVSYWLTLVLAVPTAGLLVRLFIFQHDCGHGSFFPSRRANDVLGSVLGVLTLIPYGYWRKTHAVHHATSGNLGRREFGDIITLTASEYLARPPIGRLLYRLYRNPLVLFGFGPVYQFMLKHRLPLDLPWSWRREWASVGWNNLGLVAVLAVMWQTIGLERFLLVQLPPTLIAGAAGVWLFYIQHQFEDTYWERPDDWSFHTAGLEGSSLYDLPRVLHWFTGNIGVHHVHHLCSRIPNYRLQDCLRDLPELQNVTRFTLLESLRCARLRLWDEERRTLIGFGDLSRLARRAPEAEPVEARPS